MERMPSGFSLLSLIVTLAIIVSLAAVAGETLHKRIAIARADSAAVRIEQMLLFARHAAMLQGAAVAVCLENEGANKCTADRGTNLRVHAASGAQTLLQHLHLEKTGDSLRLRSSFGAGRLLFAADGSVSLGGSLHYCPANANPALSRSFSVSAGGRIHVRAGDAAGCR